MTVMIIRPTTVLAWDYGINPCAGLRAKVLCNGSK